MPGVSASSGWTALLAGMIVAGVGIGLANPAIASTALGVVPVGRGGGGRVRMTPSASSGPRNH